MRVDGLGAACYIGCRQPEESTSTANSEDIGTLLEQAEKGNEAAQHRLIEVVYEELRIMAHGHLRRQYGTLTLCTTALVNEAFVKLFSARRPPFRGQAYFFGAAARAMRQVVIDLARLHKSRKHGGDQQRVALDVDELEVEACASELLELDEALRRLAKLDERLSRVVECRFFGGLTEEQTSSVVGTTARTVRRDWRKAQAFLYHQLHGSAPARGS